MCNVPEVHMELIRRANFLDALASTSGIFPLSWVGGLSFDEVHLRGLQAGFSLNSKISRLSVQL